MSGVEREDANGKSVSMQNSHACVNTGRGRHLCVTKGILALVKLPPHLSLPAQFGLCQEFTRGGVERNVAGQTPFLARG